MSECKHCQHHKDRMAEILEAGHEKQQVIYSYKEQVAWLQKKIDEVNTVKVIGNDLLREIVEDAHMAGQINAGVDPSYSEAQLYYDKLFKEQP